MNLILAVLILAIAQSEATPPVKGKLCFADGACQTISGTSIAVSAEDAARRFVWTSEDSRTVVVGELPEGETVVQLDALRPSGEARPVPEHRTVRFSLRGEASRGWPADAGIVLSRSREERWDWSVPAAAHGDEITVHLPDGNYGLTILAPRHQPERRRLRLDRDLRLGELTLKPAPVISGRVTRLDGEEVRPVEGAQLMLDSGTIAASTNEQGAFRTELGEPLPKELLVVSPGLASRVILFDKPLEADNDLGEIRLDSGASLTLNIDRPDELRSKPLGVQLLRKERRYEHSKIGRRTLAAGDDVVQFSDLPEGKYFVLIEGKEELERMVVPIEMETENVEREIEIRPYRLNGTVTVGDEKPGGGHVELMPFGYGPTWRAKLPIEAEGKFGDVLWQTGVLSGFVQLPDASGGLLLARSPELGSDPSSWPIRFKKRLIHGRVTDAGTGEGLGSVSFQLQTTSSGGGRGYSSVKVAPSGEYEILAWRDGTYDLIVSAGDYLPKTTTVALSENDGSRRVDIALESGIETTLEFIWPTGQPVANAQVIEGVARDGHNPQQMYTTDAAGRLTLRMQEGTPRLLYIIPREGSFAPVRVPGTSSDRPLRFEVPAPVGLLRVRLVDGEGNADRGVVVMRYNGEWVPYSVTGRLRMNYSPGMAEFSALPAGSYEVWAVRGVPGGPTAPHTPPAHPPVSTGLAAGETTIEVTVVEGG